MNGAVSFSLRSALRVLRVALATAFIALFAAQAFAGPLEDALAKLSTDKFDQTEAGIGEVVSSGAPQAAAIIEAMGENRLVFKPGNVAIKTKDGQLVDAATMKPVTDDFGYKPVRLNNRVRRALEAAVGATTLMSPDPAVRLSAAEAVFKSRDAAALPTLDAALAKEQNAKIKKALTEARAAVILAKADATDSEKVAAVEIIAERVDQDALALLNAVIRDGSPIVKLAAESSIGAIVRHLQVINAIQNVWYGLSLGSVLLLAAIGLAITFGVMGVINMAHGEMVMLGAYTTFVVQEFIRTQYPGLFGWSLPLALPLAFFVTAAVGVMIERGVIRFLYGRPLETLLATWGVSLILQQTVRTIFGPTNREVGAPSYMSGSFDFFGLAITYGRLWIVVFSLVVFVSLLIVMKATSFGLKMRAVTQNRRMASAMGIRTPWVDSMTFALGSGIAGIAGVALSQIDNVSPNLGQSYIIDSFMVVVFGGVGNLWGTFVAALTLGIANKFLEPLAGAVLGKIAVLVFIILFIQKRPRGLFALKGRAVEA
jgi:urea transport system permease protein